MADNDGAVVMTDELRRELSDITNVQRAAVLMLLLGGISTPTSSVIWTRKRFRNWVRRWYR